jgi:hypothetical protein
LQRALALFEAASVWSLKRRDLALADAQIQSASGSALRAAL